MEITNYLKCTCGHCGGPIQYLPNEGGEITECPRCHEKSRLPGKPLDLGLKEIVPLPPKPLKRCPGCGAEREPEISACPYCDEHRKRKRTFTLIGMTVSVVVIAIFAGVFAKTSIKKHEAPPQLPSGPLAQPVVKRPKSINDLKIGKFYLERKRGSDLIIATGTVENDSGNVHFGIKADVDLLDAKGAKIGNVSDVLKEIGPRQSWHFVAPVTNTNAVSLKVVSIKEDQ